MSSSIPTTPASPATVSTPVASVKPVVTKENGKLVVRITLAGRTFRVENLKLDEKKVDFLNQEDFESYATKVGELAIKLLADKVLLPKKTDESKIIKIRVCPPPSEEGTTGRDVLIDGQNEGVLDSEAASLLADVQNRTAKIFQGKEVVKTVEHKFYKEMPSKVKVVAAQTAGMAIAAIAAVVVVPVGLVVGGIYALKNRVSKGDIKTATEQMQDTEEKLRFEKLNSMFSGLKSSTKDNIVTSIQQGINDPEIYQKKLITRLTTCVLRIGIEKNPRVAKSNLESVFAGVSGDNFTNTQTLRAFLRESLKNNAEYGDLLAHVSNKDLDEVIAECSLLTDPRNVDAKINRDAETFVSFFKAVGKDPETVKDFHNQNIVVIEKFRAVLATESYQALKDDLKDPYIQQLHKFASAISNEVTIMEAQAQFGKDLTPGHNKIKFLMDTHESRKAFVSASKDARAAAKSENLEDHGWGNGSRLVYAVTHPRQALGSFAGESYWNRTILSPLLSLVNWQGYDPKRLGNHSSLQGVLEATKGEETYRINSSYGGSPTIDDAIDPIFVANLQAIRNNNELQHDEEIVNPLAYDPSIPSARVYVNLQNIENKGGEAARSVAIMAEANRFPDVLTCVTFTKDSAFFDPKGKNKQVLFDAATYANEVKEQFSKVECYTYVGRAGTTEGGGYYLPGGKAKWWGDGSNGRIHEIINKTKEHFATLALDRPTTLEEAQKLRWAFQEHVQFLIRAVIVAEAGDKAVANGLKPNIQTEESCKEDVDRGARAKTKHINAFLATKYQEHALALNAGSGSGRALRVRDRIDLDYRGEPIWAHIELVPPSISKQHVAELCNFDQASLKFTPAIDVDQLAEMQATVSKKKEKDGAAKSVTTTEGDTGAGSEVVEIELREEANSSEEGPPTVSVTPLHIDNKDEEESGMPLESEEEEGLEETPYESILASKKQGEEDPFLKKHLGNKGKSATTNQGSRPAISGVLSKPSSKFFRKPQGSISSSRSSSSGPDHPEALTSTVQHPSTTPERVEIRNDDIVIAAASSSTSSIFSGVQASKPVVEYWNNHKIEVELLGEEGKGVVTIYSPFSNHFERKEVNIIKGSQYQKGSLTSQMEKASYVPVGSFNVEKEGWKDLVDGIKSKDQTIIVNYPKIYGYPQVEYIDYNGFSVAIHSVKQNDDFEKTFEGKIAFYKDGVLCAVVPTGTIVMDEKSLPKGLTKARFKKHWQELINNDNKSVWVEKKFLENFVKAFKTKNN